MIFFIESEKSTKKKKRQQYDLVELDKIVLLFICNFENNYFRDLRISHKM